MGKSTIVSVLPFALTEEKPGLIPGYYEIPMAEKGDFSILVVKDGYHNVLIPLADDKAPPMRVTDTSEKIAESLIMDYTNACLAIDYELSAFPGLFWIEGEQTKALIKTLYAAKLKSANEMTMRWFERLVKMADDDWARYHQHRTITDLQRHACTYLNMSKEWNFNVMTDGAKLCWGCKVAIHPRAITCSNCKAIINMEEYTKNKDRYVNV